MNDAELLKGARDLLLKQHKAMVDLERGLYEGLHGRQTPGQFLNLLLENEDFAWLREFSTLIVEIDELFAQREGPATEDVSASLAKVRDLVEMSGFDDYFRAKYSFSLQRDAETAGIHSELKQLLRQ